MSDKPLITDEEYSKEVRSHSDYLNWIFGLSTMFLSIECLQFNSPWRAAVVGLAAVVPMYAYAFSSFPTSLKILRRLHAETSDAGVEAELRRIESKFHGWKVLFTNAILWLSLALYLLVLFSFTFESQISWIKA